MNRVLPKVPVQHQCGVPPLPQFACWFNGHIPAQCPNEDGKRLDLESCPAPQLSIPALWACLQLRHHSRQPRGLRRHLVFSHLWKECDHALARLGHRGDEQCVWGISGSHIRGGLLLLGSILLPPTPAVPGANMWAEDRTLSLRVPGVPSLPHPTRCPAAGHGSSEIQATGQPLTLRGLPHGLSPGLAVTLWSGACLLPQLLLLKWELNKSTSSWGLYVGSVRSQMQIVKCCPGSSLGWTWQPWELLAALLIFCQNSPGLAVSHRVLPPVFFSFMC